MTGRLAFEVPERLEAREPAYRRDAVRLLVAERGTGELRHRCFRELPELLGPEDLLVVNTSGTLPAAVPIEAGLVLHLSAPVPGSERWIVELRRDGARYRGGAAGRRFALPGGGAVTLVAPYLGSRLWVAELTLPGPLLDYLARHGEPIRYRHAAAARPLEDYQTVYATEPGSAEMPSAGRPFTAELITSLVARGIAVAPLVLHTGVSSLEAHEPPYPERYRVPPRTAWLVGAARRRGGRVVAVGTTVVRALETVAAEDGSVRAGAGWTRLVVTPERGVRAVDALLTGWHEPNASHLMLLEAVAGRDLLERSYEAALEYGYRWHEFGDLHLILP